MKMASLQPRTRHILLAMVVLLGSIVASLSSISAFGMNTFSNFTCLQENTNKSFGLDGSCNILYSGSYNFSFTGFHVSSRWTDYRYLIDELYSTSTITNDTLSYFGYSSAIATINYTKPTKAYAASIRTRNGRGWYNVSVGSTCFNSNTNELKYIIQSTRDTNPGGEANNRLLYSCSGTLLYLYNPAGSSTDLSYATIYEESILWNISANMSETLNFNGFRKESFEDIDYNGWIPDSSGSVYLQQNTSTNFVPGDGYYAIGIGLLNDYGHNVTRIIPYSGNITFYAHAFGNALVNTGLQVYKNGINISQSTIAGGGWTANTISVNQGDILTLSNYESPDTYGIIYIDNVTYVNSSGSRIPTYHTRYLDIPANTTITAAYLNVTNSSALVLNPMILINTTQIWNVSGQLASENKTTDFAKYINSYTKGCKLSASCSVPITFSSETEGNITYYAVNFDNTGFIENLNTANTTTYDTSLEGFVINITYDKNYYRAITPYIVYNGISYAATNTTYDDYALIKASFDIPITNVPINNSYLWEIFLTNSSGTININSSTYYQYVLPTHFIICNFTTPSLVNYTIWDEIGLVNINSTFKSTFGYYLGSGTVVKNASFDFASNSTFRFCSYTNKTFYVDADIDLYNSNYAPRKYDFINKIYSNITTEQYLYLLNITSSSDIIIEVKDEGYTALEDYLVEIYRKYPETNTYVMVESRKTDIFGQFVAKLVENDVLYKFKFYDSDGALVKTTGDVSVACRSTICIVPFIVEDTSDPFERYDDIEDYTSSLTFNNNTNIFTFSWTDNTGANPTHRLEVIRYLMNGTTSVCNSTSTALVGSLTCSVGGMKASYTAQGYRMASPENRKTVLTVKVGDLSARFGYEGLFWSFVLLFTLIAIGAYNPTVGMVLYLAGYLFLGILDIAFINPAIMIADLVIGALFIWAFRN